MEREWGGLGMVQEGEKMKGCWRALGYGKEAWFCESEILGQTAPKFGFMRVDEILRVWGFGANSAKWKPKWEGKNKTKGNFRGKGKFKGLLRWSNLPL